MNTIANSKFRADRISTHEKITTIAGLMFVIVFMVFPEELFHFDLDEIEIPKGYEKAWKNRFDEDEVFYRMMQLQRGVQPGEKIVIAVEIQYLGPYSHKTLPIRHIITNSWLVNPHEYPVFIADKIVLTRTLWSGQSFDDNDWVPENLNVEKLRYP